MTRRRRPRTAQERVIGVLGTVAPGSLGGRIRNTRPAVVVQPNTGGPPDTGGAFDPNEDPVIIGAGASAGGGSTPTAVSGGFTHAVVVGTSALVGSNGAEPGDSAVAVGRAAHATADGAVAVGGGNAVASNTRATVVGTESVASGDHSTCLGCEAAATGGQSTAVGEGSIAAGQYSVAVGGAAEVDTDGGTALGAQSWVKHTSSTAVGSGATTTKAHQIMLGTVDEFVEVPGNGVHNGIVLKDTATGTRYLVQITSGALVLSTAP